MIKFSKEIMELALSKMQRCDLVKVMCSMGVDSLAVSHFFEKKIKDKYGSWGIMHFNHEQRQQNYLMEERYSNFGYNYGIPRYSPVRLKSGGYYASSLEPTEDNFREARLNYIKRSLHRNTIFITAHHLDDATESYMMNILRGKEGFLPIPFITEVETNLIVHPFLFTKKKDFIQYAEKNDLMKYVVEDETNKVTKGSRRNFIRNEIMPLIQREKIGLDTIVKKKMHERLMLEIIS